MDTYDLNSGGSGGTPLTYSPSIPDNGAGTGLNVPVTDRNQQRVTGYDSQREMVDRKNNANKQQSNMLSSMSFSTPIEELGYDEPMEDPMIPPQSSVAPQEMLAQRSQYQQPPPQQQQQEEREVLPPPPPEKTYPLGLTKDQFEAITLVVMVALVFYPLIQEKLAIYVPNFMDKDGNRSVLGLVVSGAIVALGFYLARRYF